jgi:CobQ-like glutamine amidotransferase family enzyme
MTSVTLVQLYPDELGVAGDRGNVLALRERLSRAGVAVTVVEHNAGDTLPTAADLVVVGNGPLSAMRNVYDDLQVNAATLREWVAAGVALFAYGSGAELLGRGISLLDGSVIDGLGILPFRTTRVTGRKVGYVLTDTAFGPLVGFEDNASTWALDDAAQALGTVQVGGGNGDGTEGVIAGSAIGTQVGGPVLPLNPLLTDAILAMATARLDIEYVPTAADAPLDEYAARARDVIVANAKHVFSRI